MMEKKEKVMAARAASAPCETPLLILVRCHWFARKQKATNQRKDKKPGREQNWSVLPGTPFAEAQTCHQQDFQTATVIWVPWAVLWPQ